MLIHIIPSLSSYIKGVYAPKCVILHAALLHQTCVHCAIFPTAASRRSLVRVSVPVWRIILSDPLCVIGLVSHYLTNYLIQHRPIPRRKNISQLTLSKKEYPVLAVVSNCCPGPGGTLPMHYSPVRHSSAGASSSVTVRLACVKHAASVHSEPGSNSP